MRRAIRSRSASSTAVQRRLLASNSKSSGSSIEYSSVLAATSYLSKKYRLATCSCNSNSRSMMPVSSSTLLSKSANALWKRSNASKKKNEHSRNNSTLSQPRGDNLTHRTKFSSIRHAVTHRLKRNRKKLPTITARSVPPHRVKANMLKRQARMNSDSNEKSTPAEIDAHQTAHSPSNTLPFSSGSPSSILSEPMNEGNTDEDEGLPPSTSRFKPEYQNINATNTISQTGSGVSPTVSVSAHSSKVKTRKTTATKRKANPGRPRSTVHSKFRSQSQTKKRKGTSTIKRAATKSKQQKSTTISRIRSADRLRSPFTHPEMFHSLTPLQDPKEITKDNVQQSHLCCKPITSVKKLSTSDQKKLIEHDYLTLISLLPMYLGAQGDFQHKLREKTQITHDGAAELERLMHEWGSARLFIGANSHCKTLTQTI